MVVEYVKENVRVRAPVPAWVVACCLGAAGASLWAAALLDQALPEPLTRAGAPPDRFIAEIAHQHLVNLTNIGPRVAGTYENEVAAVAVLVAAVKQIAREASAHNTLDIDVQRASGAFNLSFFDGMNNIYSDIQNVVVRARSVGGRPGRRSALLINCHYDTVPDSPGASDDAAGCAVGLETLRALVAAPRPLRHDVILLLNGAEENIMQASHAFITQHKWAGSVRAFINVEACGAGGREVMFQAGPRDPWIIEVYAHAVPHPFASSLAQEMFQSGIIPADTDFRIFRDFGQLSGVDLAWSSDGYVYHTRLDAAERVAPRVLQRTGDNVLALAAGLLNSGKLETWAENGGDDGGGQPVFFDLLGLVVVVARPGVAVLLALATAALVLLRLRVSADHAHKQLYISRRAWMRVVFSAGMKIAGAGAMGAASGAAVGALRVRSAYLPLLWTLLPTAADLLASAAGADGRARAWWWAGGLALPLLQGGYVARDALALLLPLAARAGTPPIPVPVVMTTAVALIVLLLCSWVAVLALAARDIKYIAWAALVCGAAGVWCACAGGLEASYSAERPQRLMMFHVRSHTHLPGEPDAVRDYYWVPELDPNMEARVETMGLPWRRGGAGAPGEPPGGWVYGGAPYSLPVRGLVARWAELDAPGAAPDHAAVLLNYTARALPEPGRYQLHLHIQGPSHVVVIVSPGAGGAVVRAAGGGLRGAPRPGAAWGRRHTYFLAWHTARPRPARELQLTLQLPMKGDGQEGAPWSAAQWAELCQVSVAGHALGGARHPHHQRAMDALPPHVAPTGWPVHLHLYRLLRPQSQPLDID